MSDPRGAPLWPDGVVGSITHCEGFCCAVLARQTSVRSIGIDAEVKAPLHTAMARIVCRPEELAHFAGLPLLVGTTWTKLAFSSKKAFHKCFYPLTGITLDFRDVSVHFTATPAVPSGTFSIPVVPSIPGQDGITSRIAGRWAFDGSRVYTTAVGFDGGFCRCA